MSYSSLYIKKGEKTLIIMGVVAFISLCIGVYSFVNQYGQKNGWQKTIGIEKVIVTNISPHGFEVSWSTSKPVKDIQWVEVAKEKGTYSIQGKLDVYGGVNHVLISELSPNTHYNFRIRQGVKTYILPALVPDSLQTPKEAPEKPISPAYGKVMLPSLKPFVNGLLIYEVDGFYPLSAFTKETGEWILPLTGLVSKKTNAIMSVGNENQVSITLFSFPEGTIRTSVGQTRPLRKAITAGTSIRMAQTLEKNSTSSEESVLGVSSQNTPSFPISSSSVLYPKENAIIPGNAPLIKGIAPIGSDVTILIQSSSKQYSYRTNTDEKGEWMIQNPVVLEAGKYTITVTTKISGGVSSLSRRSFTIIKSGEQVMGVATGSPTLAPTVPAPTYTNPTIGPTIPITSNPTVIPTATLTPLVTTVTPTAAALLKTGGGITGYLFGALFCIVVGTGLVLAF